jgi:fatty-acyl-CoA synthase
MVNLASCLGLTDRDAVLPVVPMFHANAWGIPYAALMAGSKIVLAGAASADPAALVGLIQGERVTVTAGVPTVWTALLHHLEATRCDLSSLRLVTVGGSAASVSMIERFKSLAGVDVVQGWGMTETGPVASLSFPTDGTRGLPESEQIRMRARQGRVVPGVRFRVVSPDGCVAPWDDLTKGELEVKGNWVAESYYKDEKSAERFDDGWLRTGDIAVVDAQGSIRIIDRAKDLVKSGGEWISSVDLELELAGHPSVLEAAVIGVPDEKWDERPLACVVVKPGTHVTPDELRKFLSSRVPKWWLPDEIVFVAELPKTSVGKLDKKLLRQRFRERRSLGA